MNPNALRDWAPALFPLFFAGMWVGILLMISAVGGWGRLASHYRRTESITGTTWRFKSMGMRLWMPANYGGCLFVIANDEGIGFSVLFLFRIGHPPLFIPWSDIEVIEERFFYVFKRVRLTFSEEPSVAMWLDTKLAKKIQAAVGQDWFAEVGQRESDSQVGGHES